MKRLVIVGVAACVAAVLPVLAEQQDKDTGAADKPAKVEKAAKVAKGALEDLTVSGTLEKEGTRFAVKQADGTMVKVYPPKPGKPGETPVDLDKFVGKTVKLTGKGKCKDMGGKKSMAVYSVTSVEEAAAPAAETAAEKPAAPAAE